MIFLILSIRIPPSPYETTILQDDEGESCRCEDPFPLQPKLPPPATEAPSTCNRGSLHLQPRLPPYSLAALPCRMPAATIGAAGWHRSRSRLLNNLNAFGHTERFSYFCIQIRNWKRALPPTCQGPMPSRRLRAPPLLLYGLRGSYAPKPKQIYTR